MPVSPLVKKLLILNTFLVFLIIATAFFLTLRLSQQVQPLRDFAASNPGEIFSQIIKSSTLNFFLGSPYGSVGTFLQTMMLTNFSSVGRSVNSFSNAVQNSFAQNGPLQPSCNQSYNCGNVSGYFACPNGELVWCNPNAIVNCAQDSCIYNSGVTAASWVSTVSSRIALWGNNSNSSTSSIPAFSDSVFRLNYLVPWLQAQTSVSTWAAAGKTCTSFTQQMRGIEWKGSYLDTNGNYKDWNGNSGIHQAMGYIDQVCGIFAAI